MKSSLSNQPRRGNAPARILWFSARAPAGAGCAGTAETGQRRLSRTKANTSTKLGIAFEEDCLVTEQIPVRARPTKHFDPGARRDSPSVSKWLFPPAPDGNKGVLPIQNGDRGAGIGGARKRKG